MSKNELKEFTNEQLEEEIEGRKIEDTAPKPLKDMDFSKIIEYCKDYIEEIKKKESVDSDTPHYIFEAAMEAIFSKEVWKWVNKNAQ